MSDHDKEVTLTKEDVDKLRANIGNLKKSTKDRTKRVFCNRPLRLDRIYWLGFDLDYTLALYKSPEYDAMTYELLKEELLLLGYPKSIISLKYDPKFILRGILVDTMKGNFLKLDRFSEIVACYHGRTRVPKKETSTQYPSLRIPTEDIGKSGYSLANTSYDLPRAALYGDLIDHFEKMNTVDASCNVLSSNKVDHQNLWEDISKVLDKIHQTVLKQKTLENLDKYVEDGTALSQILVKLRAAGKKLFLLTNSPFYYADAVMSWLLNGKAIEYPKWTDYFDVSIVEAQKPIFFLGNHKFREVSPTGHLKLDVVDELKKGVVYCHGNLRHFEKLCGISAGNNVLYVGDHIFSDVLISKKKHAWRTLLIIPELQSEEAIGKSEIEAFQELLALAKVKEKFFGNIDPSLSSVEISALKNEMSDARDRFDDHFNENFGSMFRNGLHSSFFAMQVGRYADLYTTKVWNLLEYSVATHNFSPPFQPFPHERDMLDSDV